MPEIKTLNGGSFSALGLHRTLVSNIMHDRPTPIQRKALPLILEGRSLMATARTGSGKTLCYLLPAIQRAIDGQNSLILLPTKELAAQVRRVCRRLSHRLEVTGKLEITTLRALSTDGFSLLVVDEIDRVLEEKSLREHFTKISERFTGQRLYFSATLPDEPLNVQHVQIEMRIPEAIKHTFLYVPSEAKEAALLDVLDRAKKTIVFAATRYGVDFLLAVLHKYGIAAHGIYSSMDDEAREENFGRFMAGRVNVLVVTDVAARGLDIPQLDVSISYDMCDEKTFVHRVGRVRGVGEQYSLVTYTDVFHFFNIRETHLPGVEIGTVPQEVLDRYGLHDLDHLRYAAQRGYQRCLNFRRKVSVPSEFKALVDGFAVHSRYAQHDTLAAQLRRLRSRPETATAAPPSDTTRFRDQFYIPYARKEVCTHSSSFAVSKDDYVRHKAERSERPRWMWAQRARRMADAGGQAHANGTGKGVPHGKQPTRRAAIKRTSK